MSNSLQRHGIKEVYKQLRMRMKNSGLETIKVEVTRQAGKYKYNFTGSRRNRLWRPRRFLRPGPDLDQGQCRVTGYLETQLFGGHSTPASSLGNCVGSSG